MSLTRSPQIYRRDDPKTAYELYGTGSAPLGRIFGAGRFDRGITMLLACTKELLAYASSRPRGGVAILPPYAIEGDLVGGFSVRLQVPSPARPPPTRARRLVCAPGISSDGRSPQFNQEEKWTQAFKCLLDDLKWLLAWHAAG